MTWLSKRSEAKRSETFDNDVSLDIEAKQTRLIVRKFILKQSEHVYLKELKNRSEAKQINIKLRI